MKQALALCALLILCSFAGAAAVSILSPVSGPISDGSQVSIGVVGPGQTFRGFVNPSVSTGGKYGIGGAYDQMFATGLPYGWTSAPSKLYANPLQVEACASCARNFPTSSFVSLRMGSDLSNTSTNWSN